MTINKQALREAAAKAKEFGNISRYTKATIARQEFKEAATPDVVLALLDELEAAEKRIAEQREYYEGVIADGSRRIAELEAQQAKPVMFIDGDISPADADKLAAVIREFNEETETPAARMARIIRENPHPTNMCDMPAAGIGVKGE